MHPKKKIYLTLTIFLILSVFWIVFLIYPLFKEIKKNSQEILLEKKKTISLAKEKENFKELEKIYKTYQNDFGKIENLFIDPETPIEFIKFLEEIATTSGVQLEIFSLAKKKQSENLWNSLFFQFSVSGSFPDFLKFLNKLENSPYLINFLDFNIKKDPFLTTINAFLLIEVFSK